MTATYTGASLADGQLPDSSSAIYTVTSLTVAFVRSLTLFNNSATSQTIVMSIQRSGGAVRNFRQIVLAQNESADAIDNPVVLSAGDSIYASTTTANEVDFTITGVLAA